VPLQNLHHRLLDESIQYSRDAELAHPAVRFGDFYPPHRLWFVGSIEQLFSDCWPVLFQVIRDLVYRHAVNARTTFISLHLPNRFLQVSSLTYFPINRSVLAGFSVPFVALNDSDTSAPILRASPVDPEEKSSCIWIFRCMSFLRLMAYWPLLLVGAFDYRSLLGLSVAPPFGSGVPH